MRPGFVPAVPHPLGPGGHAVLSCLAFPIATVPLSAQDASAGARTFDSEKDLNLRWNL